MGLAPSVLTNDKTRKKLPTTERRKINRLPTWPTLYGYLYPEIRGFFLLLSFVYYFPFLSQVFCLICFQHREGQLYFRPGVNHRFHYLQISCQLNYLCGIVMKTKQCRFDFRFSLGTYRRTPILYLHFHQNSFQIVRWCASVVSSPFRWKSRKARTHFPHSTW